jgi:potassium uptake TrkH family protein
MSVWAQKAGMNEHNRESPVENAPTGQKEGFFHDPGLWRKFPVFIRIAIGTLSFCMLIRELGWPISGEQTIQHERLTWLLIAIALLTEAWQAHIDRKRKPHRYYYAVILAVVLGIFRFSFELLFSSNAFEGHFPEKLTTIAGLVLVQASLVGPLVVYLLGLTRSNVLQAARPGSLFIIGFILTILAGTLLLKLPNATKEGISWADALFTSTSAVCVTGLIVVDTEHDLTTLGQYVVLLLIQIGGLSIVTLTYFLSLILGQGITLRDRHRLRKLFSEQNTGELTSFITRVVIITAIIELTGTILIHLTWHNNPVRPDHSLSDALFHSVSAFCNAGFSTFSEGLASPQVAYNRPLQVVVMMLIIAGGIGFVVLQELMRYVSGFAPKLYRHVKRLPQKRLELHVWLALSVTFLLLPAGFLCLWLLTDDSGQSLSGRIWAAAFNSVTARTAGFNINDFSQYEFSSVIILCILMFIGGCPGGTAGGVKTTTFAVAIGELMRLIRGRSSLHLLGRRIPRDTVERCQATVVVSVIFIVGSAFLLSATNPGLNPVDIVFECVSAFSTVGLSRGITADLNPAGKLIIIMNMFAGRIGILLLVTTLAGSPRKRHYELPEGQLPLN